jgi:hypothetical protein
MQHIHTDDDDNSDSSSSDRDDEEGDSEDDAASGDEDAAERASSEESRAGDAEAGEAPLAPPPHEAFTPVGGLRMQQQCVWKLPAHLLAKLDAAEVGNSINRCFVEGKALVFWPTARLLPLGKSM